MKAGYVLQAVAGTLCRTVLALGIVFVPLNLVFAAVPVSFVQEKDHQVTNGTTNSVAFTSSTTAGNLIAVYLIWDNLGSATVSDSAGNTYLSAVGPSGWNNNRYRTQVFYAKNIRGGRDTVTATFSTAVKAFGIVYAHEYSQLDKVSPVDAVSAAVGSGTSINSGSVVTSSPNALLFGAGVSMNVISRPGPSYTARSTAQGNMTEDRVVTTNGTYNATATNSNDGWGMQLVAFRFAGSVQQQGDTSPPTVPTGLSPVAVSPSQINLSWAASTDPNNTPAQLNYRIYRNGSLIGTTAAGTTSWQDTGLASGTTYTYAVSAQDPSGNSSAPSPGVQASTPTVAPSISSFKANPAAIIAGQKTTLSWTVSNASSLVIDNGVGNVTGQNSITITPVATATYTLTAANSSASVTAQTTATLSPDTIAPSVPKLSATATTSTQANLSWTTSTDNVGVTGYRLYRNGTLILDTTSNSYSDTGLTAGTTYRYTIAAYDAAGNSSAQSTPVSVTPTNADTQPPSVSVTSPTSDQTVTGVWTVTANVTDNVGVSGVQFVLDGSNMGQEITAAPYSETWNTAQTAEGTHILTAVARDAAGHTTTSSGVSFTVRNSSTGSSGSGSGQYTLTPTLIENPISDNGQWLNGRRDGVVWNDVQTKPGMIFSSWPGNAGSYADSTAVLTGTWAQNQTATATINCPTQVSGQEVELRLNSSIAANRNDGYEINFSCGRDKYNQIVRWNGALGNFTILSSVGGTSATVKTGDVVKATRVGNVITAYNNGVQINRVSDSTFLGGAPGVGFWRDGGGSDGNFGFSSFTADDGTGGGTATAQAIVQPAPPANSFASVQITTTAKISWPAVKGATSYKIYRGANPGGPYTLRGSSTTTSFSEIVAPGIYYYVVTVVNAGGESSYSPEVSVQVQ